MRARATARSALALAAAVFVVLGCSSALAYFTSAGEGSVDTGVSNLGKPTISTAVPAVGGSVTVTWGAVTPPQTGTVSYFVTRDGEPASGTCPTESAPTTVLTCIDKEVEPGAHTYVVTAVWRSWTAESAAKAATVTIGPATHLTITAATTGPVAGAADNLTIAAKDSAETTVTNYTGTKSLVFSGASASPGGTNPTVSNSSGTATSFGAATSITFSSGIAVVNTTTRNGVMRIYRAGEAAISVTDGTISTDTPLAVKVAPATLSKFVLGLETTTPPVGDAQGLTITAQDQYANVVTGHDGPRTLTFSGASASPGGNPPTVTDAAGEEVAFGTGTAIAFTEGVATSWGAANGVMRLYRSASSAVKVVEGAISSATVTAVPVAGVADRIALSASTTTPAAGGTVSLTHTAQDVYGNTATSYTGAKSLTYSGAGSSPAGNAPAVVNSGGTTVAFGGATAINFTSGVAAVSSSRNGRLLVYAAGPSAITVSDGTISNTTPLALTVSAATISKLILEAEQTTAAVGAANDLRITATDTYANPILTYAGTKNVTFSGASASPGGNAPTVTDKDGNAIAFGTATPLTFVAGVAFFDGANNGRMRLYRSGAATVKATEGSVSGSQTITSTAGSAAKFGIATSAATIAANGTASLTTTAQDTYGNTATTYTGSKSLTFSGALASPSGSAPTVVNGAGTAIAFGSATAITFTSGVAAVSSNKNGLVRLFRSGSNAISVSDGEIDSTTPVTIAVNPATASRLIFVDLVASKGSIGSPCLFTCTISGIGNSGTLKGGIAVTDAYGNVNSNIGSGHTAAVTVTGGGSVAGGTVTFPSSGLAESPGEFTYTAPSSGGFTAAIKAAVTGGTAYTQATATTTR